jgi:glutaredoxin
MPRIVLTAFAVLLAALFATSAAAQTYRWVDKDGKVHYSQTPPPPSQATKVEKRSAGGSMVESTQQLPYSTQQAAKNFPVTIYTAESCADPCKEGRALLSQRGVPFREVAVTDEKSRAELTNVSGGDAVPVLVVGKQVTKGYLADVWHTALDSAGYPRSGPPVAAKAQKPEAQPAAKAEAPESAAAAQPPKQTTGRYAPPPPTAKEAQDAASQQATRTGRYAPPAGDASAPATPAAGPYAPK